MMDLLESITPYVLVGSVLIIGVTVCLDALLDSIATWRRKMGTSTDAIIAFGFDLGESLGEWIEEVECGDLRNFYYRSDDGPMLVRHCSASFPMTILCMKQSYVCASRGHPEVVNLDVFDDEATTKWKAELIEFTKEYGLEDLIKGKKPRWLLFSWMG